MEQRAVCHRFATEPVFPEAGSKIGMALNVRSGACPINGLRHAPEHGTNGWYIWASETFPDDDGFVPLHVEHVSDWHPDIEHYLALPPGWRFLIAGDYEDVWYDATLLVQQGDG
jgi:hypothetical protein